MTHTLQQRRRSLELKSHENAEPPNMVLVREQMWWSSSQHDVASAYCKIYSRVLHLLPSNAIGLVRGRDSLKALLHHLRSVSGPQSFLSYLDAYYQAVKGEKVKREQGSCSLQLPRGWKSAYSSLML